MDELPANIGILKLPRELTGLIAKMIPRKRDLGSLRLVSHAFEALFSPWFFSTMELNLRSPCHDKFRSMTDALIKRHADTIVYTHDLTIYNLGPLPSEYQDPPYHVLCKFIERINYGSMRSIRWHTGHICGETLLCSFCFLLMTLLDKSQRSLQTLEFSCSPSLALLERYRTSVFPMLESLSVSGITTNAVFLKAVQLASSGCAIFKRLIINAHSSSSAMTLNALVPPNGSVVDKDTDVPNPPSLKLKVQHFSLSETGALSQGISPLQSLNLSTLVSLKLENCILFNQIMSTLSGGRVRLALKSVSLTFEENVSVVEKFLYCFRGLEEIYLVYKDPEVYVRLEAVAHHGSTLKRLVYDAEMPSRDGFSPNSIWQLIPSEIKLLATTCPKLVELGTLQPWHHPPYHLLEPESHCFMKKLSTLRFGNHRGNSRIRQDSPVPCRTDAQLFADTLQDPCDNCGNPSNLKVIAIGAPNKQQSIFYVDRLKTTFRKTVSILTDCKIDEVEQLTEDVKVLFV